MKIRLRSDSRGIALIMVMVAVFVLGILAGGFAYSMKVEMRLAQNHNSEDELEWLGRSGVELASYVVAQQLTVPNERYDALNQKWAGGIGVTNEALADIELENVRLGSGTFSVKIIDQERFFNINVADQVILRQAMTLIGVDAAESPAIIDSILDWIDLDDAKRLSGAESNYYLGLPSPYYAKNGPIDDLTELMLVKGITPEMYWGPAGTNYATGAGIAPATRVQSKRLHRDETLDYQVGLKDLFTPVSGRLININTASAAVLQLIPNIDANIAQAIVQTRAGPDGVEGNEDDTPFRNVGELINVPGMDRGLVTQVGRYFSVMSATYEVQVTAHIGNYQKTYLAMIRRNNQKDVQTLFFNWK
jgi:general secretion pathway protein K